MAQSQPKYWRALLTPNVQGSAHFMRDPNSETTARFEHATRDGFTETRWTQVTLAAGQDGSTAAQHALEELCARYWRSIYSFLRRKGHAPSDAEDLTQSFFGQLLGEDAFARADRTKGRFRNFLLGALERFLVDESRRHRAQKRGGGRFVQSLDFQGAEERYQVEADPGQTAEQIYDRRWAATVLETAFAELQKEFHEAGQLVRFGHLKKFLSAPPDGGDYDALAVQLDLTPNAVAAAVSRLRQRYREIVRANLKATVTSTGDLETELRELFQ